MEVPWEFVELLESHAEITIRDTVAHKRFLLVFRTLERRGTVWMPLTLEPGQRVVGITGGLMATENSGTVWLGLPADRSEFSFETVERLRLERRRYRIETFNAFRHQESAPLRRRTANARIELSGGVYRVFSPSHPVTVDRLDRHTSTLRLDVGGAASLGRFRFFVEPSNPIPVLVSEGREGDELTLNAVPVPGSAGLRPWMGEREFVEPRRSRPRRRGSLRRLP